MSISEILTKLAEKQAVAGNHDMAFKLVSAADKQKCALCKEDKDELVDRKGKSVCEACGKEAKCALKGCKAKKLVGEMIKRGGKHYCCNACVKADAGMERSALDEMLAKYTKKAEKMWNYDPYNPPSEEWDNEWRIADAFRSYPERGSYITTPDGIEGWVTYSGLDGIGINANSPSEDEPPTHMLRYKLSDPSVSTIGERFKYIDAPGRKSALKSMIKKYADKFDHYDDEGQEYYYPDMEYQSSPDSVRNAFRDWLMDHPEYRMGEDLGAAWNHYMDDRQRDLDKNWKYQLDYLREDWKNDPERRYQEQKEEQREMARPDLPEHKYSSLKSLIKKYAGDHMKEDILGAGEPEIGEDEFLAEEQYKLEKQVMEYLDYIAESGFPMLKAAPYIQKKFNLSDKEAVDMLDYWYETLGDRHDKYSSLKSLVKKYAGDYMKEDMLGGGDPEIGEEEFLTEEKLKLEYRVMDYLDYMAESGFQMLGAAPYIQKEFNLSDEEAVDMLDLWYETFGDRHDKYSSLKSLVKKYAGDYMKEDAPYSQPDSFDEIDEWNAPLEIQEEFNEWLVDWLIDHPRYHADDDRSLAWEHFIIQKMDERDLKMKDSKYSASLSQMIKKYAGEGK